MKIFRFIYLIALTALFITPVVAQNENADAVYQKLVKEYTLKPDGSTVYRLQKQIKLLSQLSFNRLYGETFIVYNPQCQKLSINKAFTVTADGKTVNTPKNAFNEVLPGFAADAPAFNHLREMVVTHTATEIGAIINLDYSLTSSKDFIPFLSGQEIVGENSPIDELVIRIKVPKGKTLNYRMYNCALQPDKREESKMDVYEWRFKNIPALSNESFQEKDLNSIPHLLFGSVDMPSSIQWMTSKAGFNSGLTSEIKSKIDELLKNETGDIQKILKIQSLLAGEISTLNIPMIYAGYNPRTPAQIWASNAATRLEKAILFSQILNYAGIPANPVMSFPSVYFDKNVGNLAGADILVEAKPHKGETLLLSPDQKDILNKKYAIGGRTLIDLSPTKSFTSKAYSFPENQLAMEGNLNWNPTANTLEGTLSLTMTNAMNPYFDFSKDSSKVKNYLAGGLSSKDISKVSISRLTEETTKTQLTVTDKNASRVQDDYYFMDIPAFKNGSDDWHLSVMLSDRSIPLEIPNLLEEDYELDLTIPDGFVMVNKPVEIKNGNTLGISIYQSGNHIKIKRSLHLAQKTLSHADYTSFREAMIQWNNTNYRTIVLKKANN